MNMARKTAKKPDPMLVGYHFMYDNEKNPYDYITNPETGLRPGTNVKPTAVTVHYLNEDGVEGSTIPPLAIWKQGEWLSDMAPDVLPKTGVYPKEDCVFDTWVTSGEGTPGNMQYRMYVLPHEISRTNLQQGQIPKHPQMWPRKLKERPKWTGYGSGWSSYGGTSKKSSPDKLPYGIRIRCTKCGHWFQSDDLVTHVQCCPQVNEFTDWAIKCECCTSMDLTATVKEGFPRAFYGGPKPEPEAEQEQTHSFEPDMGEEQVVLDLTDEELDVAIDEALAHGELVTPDGEMPRGGMENGAGASTPERAPGGAADAAGSGAAV